MQVLLKLPLWSRWHSEEASADPAPAERYTMHSVRGDQLTSLYPIELTAVDLGHLAACLDLFVEADKVWRPVPEQACAEPRIGRRASPMSSDVSWKCCCCRPR
ncbi:hypothetical protein [Streptomyces sp. PSKA30]|uniref:hypothetical protein n=1 Tax=Streptomyces sp. PSKA30 TaxID=2874597 RepID=UPI001CD04586|nr:hypothetical protein [Streptomyces sp. PSKA30]MBZ9645402.1 hypothetical protein [Streptomyces sp. PSKA30]